MDTTLPTGELKVAWYGLFKKQRCVLRIVVPHGYLAVRLPLLLPLACVTWRFFRLRKSQTKLVVNGSNESLTIRIQQTTDLPHVPTAFSSCGNSVLCRILLTGDRGRKFTIHQPRRQTQTNTRNMHIRTANTVQTSEHATKTDTQKWHIQITIDSMNPHCMTVGFNRKSV